MKPIAFLGLAGVLAVAACVPRPRPAPPVQTTPVRPAPAPPQAPPSGNWLDQPQTSGDWRYSPGPGGGRAVFGTAGTALFTMRCDLGAHTLVLTRANAAGAARMTIRTETQSRILDGGQDSSDLFAMSARVAAGDRLLDAMALSKGRFGVEIANSAPLYLPSWAEVTRVIEDCR